MSNMHVLLCVWECGTFLSGVIGGTRDIIAPTTPPDRHKVQTITATYLPILQWWPD